MTTKAKAKKRVSRARKPKTSQFDLMLKSMCEKFPDDPSSPGIVLAWLPKQDVFYGSVRRYTKHFGEGSYVVAKFYGGTAIEVATQIIIWWKKELKRKTATEMLTASVNTPYWGKENEF